MQSEDPCTVFVTFVLDCSIGLLSSPWELSRKNTRTLWKNAAYHSTSQARVFITTTLKTRCGVAELWNSGDKRTSLRSSRKFEKAWPVAIFIFVTNSRFAKVWFLRIFRGLLHAAFWKRCKPKCWLQYWEIQTTSTGSAQLLSSQTWSTFNDLG